MARPTRRAGAGRHPVGAGVGSAGACRATWREKAPTSPSDGGGAMDLRLVSSSMQGDDCLALTSSQQHLAGSARPSSAMVPKPLQKLARGFVQGRSLCAGRRRSSAPCCCALARRLGRQRCRQEALHPPSRFLRRPHRSGSAQGAGSDVSGGSSMSMEGDACSSDCESPVQPLGSGQDQRSWAWQQQTRVLRSASQTLGLNS